MSGLPVVFGGAMLGPERAFKDAETVGELYAVLEKGGVKTIDSAQIYAGSEKLIGETDGGSKFTIDTKWQGGFGGGAQHEDYCGEREGEHEVVEDEESTDISTVDIFYIHAPDTSIPLADWLPGVQEVYKSGVFSRFGLSNFQADTVQEVYDYCKKNDYVLPTVYQGNYSAVARKQDTLLFPLLRKLGMAFYAYSPIAGGFLTKTKQQIEEGAGRFDQSTFIGQMYSGMYGKPSYLAALSEWEQIANEVGCSRAELAYRWVSYNSPLDAKYGDAIIVGASSLQQLEQTLAGLKNGKLPESAAKKIDHVWSTIEHEAPLDNYHR